MTVTIGQATGGVTQTRRATLPVGGEGVSPVTFAGGLDVTNRYIVPPLPLRTARWRVKWRNYSAVTNAAGSAIALNWKGVWLGVPTFATTGAMRWGGGMTAAPTQVLASGTTPADASDYVSGWVTDTTQQLGGPGAGLQAISVGVDSGGVSCDTFQDSKGRMFSGSGAANQAGNQTPSIGSAAFTIGDLRLEVEFSAPVDNSPPIIAFVGDSNTSGYTSSGTSVQASETWPALAAARAGAVAINLGVGSTSPSSWTTSTDWKWARIDWTTTVPDYAVINLGTNDLGNAGGATTLEGQIKSAIDILVAKGVPVSRTYLATVIPHGWDVTISAQLGWENTRTALNDWCRTLPYGVAGCFDFDKAIRRKGNTLTTQLTTHSNTTAEVASVGDGIFPGASVSATGVPAGTTIAPSGVSGTTITLSAAATASATVTATIVNPSPHAEVDMLASQPHLTLGGINRLAEIVRFPSQLALA